MSDCADGDACNGIEQCAPQNASADALGCIPGVPVVCTAPDTCSPATGACVSPCDVDSDGVEEALVKVADSYIQLTAATRDDSPIAKYLEKRGEGLHHVGYRVDDCAQALQSMIDAGATPIDKAPRPGSRGTTVAFVHPKGSFGTLIELVQE